MNSDTINKNSIPKMDENKLNKDSKEYIIKMILEVLDFTRNNSFSRIAIIEKYTEYYENYPALITKIVDDPHNFEMKRIIEMLNVREKVVKKDVSYDDASLYMGQRYYDEYVKGNVKEDQ
tara:strand:- start:1283 stop:1642 length:360 start_codon:yes stop_codon:yes gene_type:complete